MNTSAQPETRRWPPQIKFIVGNEACERFSYYGMRSILAGYITGAVLKGGLGQDADTSTEIIHLFVFANYFMPLFGAWLSDKFIGRYHTILWVSLFYCAGHGVLACSDFVGGGVHGKLTCLFIGLALIAFGSGGIKPCVSAFMGDQFKPEQSHLLQKAYGAFYWAINFGSFFSFLVIPWIKDHHGYSLAFGVPGILMDIATFIFWLGTKHYVRVPPSRETKHAGFFKVFFHAFQIRLKIVAADVRRLILPKSASELEPRHLGSYGKSFWDAARSRFSESEIDAAKSVPPILFVFALVPIFWSLFDQTNSTWVLQGQKMVPAKFLGLDIGAEQMQSNGTSSITMSGFMDCKISRPRHRRGTDSIHEPAHRDAARAVVHAGNLSAPRPVRVAAATHGLWNVSGGGFVSHRRRAAKTNRGRRAVERAMADRAFPRPDRRRSFDFLDRAGVRLPRSRAGTEKHHHEFLAAHRGVRRPARGGHHQNLCQRHGRILRQHEPFSALRRADVYRGDFVQPHCHHLPLPRRGGGGRKISWDLSPRHRDI